MSVAEGDAESAEVRKAQTKPCKVCGEPIKLAAKKCIHCDSYQNWYGKLTISSTVLSLLVALVSVLTVAVPVLKNAFTPANSSLTVSFQGADSKTLSVFITNQGTRPGALRNPIGTLYVGFNIVALTAKPFNSSVPPTVIDPDKSVLMNLFGTRLGGPKDVNELREHKINKCWIEINTLDFKGVEYVAPVPVPCAKVQEFMIEAPRVEVTGGE